MRNLLKNSITALILFMVSTAYAYEPQFSIPNNDIDQNFRNIASEINNINTQSSTSAVGGGGTGITTYTDYSAGVPTSTPTAAFQLSLSTRTGTMYVSVGTNIWNWGFLVQGPLTQWTASSPAGLTSWYDASNGPTPTTSGSTLTAWNDLSATANHLTTVSGTPNVSSITQNGLPMVYFDGAEYIHGSNKADGAQPNTFFIVFKPTAWGTGATQVLFDMMAASNIFQKTNGASTVETYAGLFLVGASVSNYSPTLLTSVLNGANSTISVNGGADTVGNAAAQTNTNYPTIGSRVGYAFQFTGYIMEVLVYSGAMSADDQAKVKSHLNAKWAIY